jgi:3-dehydroquinate synthase
MTRPDPKFETAGSRPFETVRVELAERSYDIVIGQGVVRDIGTHLKAILRRPRLTIVTDETVYRLHGSRLTKALDAAGIEYRQIILPPGEGTKDWTHLEVLVDRLLDAKVERGDLVAAFGGGVVGDLVGFAASILRRGVDFVQIPTTLLGQVDSSVGGKTAINTRHGKNLVGAFHQPRLVLADIDFLQTLPEREYLAGYAEVVKYGLIDDAPFFDWLEANRAGIAVRDAEALQYAVRVSCRSKARIVAADEREEGVRALLNLGHTFGHALEAETGYSDKLLHGEGIAIGLVLAFDLSARLGLCPAGDGDRVRGHLAGLGMRTSPFEVGVTDVASLIDHMKQDKKVRDDVVTFILARGIGKAFVSRDVKLGPVEALLADATRPRS